MGSASGIARCQWWPLSRHPLPCFVPSHCQPDGQTEGQLGPPQHGQETNTPPAFLPAGEGTRNHGKKDACTCLQRHPLRSPPPASKPMRKGYLCHIQQVDLEEEAQSTAGDLVGSAADGIAELAANGELPVAFFLQGEQKPAAQLPGSRWTSCYPLHLCRPLLIPPKFMCNQAG